MKVLQINSVCGIGSTGRIATDIHSTLLEHNYESCIAYGRNLPKNCDNTIKIGRKLDEYAHIAKTRLFDRHGFGSKQATIAFIKQVISLDPDIIHLHNIHGYYINIEVLFDYIKAYNKPVVWTLHDCWSFTGHCSYFDFVKCFKWESECSSCPQKTVYPSSFLLDNSKSNFSIKKGLFNGVNKLTIVTPSTWLSEYVKKSFLSDNLVSVIHNGIDLNAFKPIESSFRQDRDLIDSYVILGVAAPWTERKGLAYFIELSKTLPADMKIVLVGLSQQQIKDLPDNIIGIMKTTNISELAEIYSAADVFVNPTLEDNFPTTNIEALACGTPVITFNTAGSPEAIAPGCGLVTKEKSAASLLEAIEELRVIGKAKLTQNCISRATENFNKMGRYNDYIEIYKSLI